MALPATIRHSFHPNHELNLVTSPPWLTTGVFSCDGCKQPGNSWEQFYGCEACKITVHTHCATAPAVLEHPLFVGISFRLHDFQKTQDGYMNCQACGGETLGFRYVSYDPYVYLHPCCAVMPTRVVDQDDHVFHLVKDSSVKCGICKGKSQWPPLSYRTSNDKGEHVYLHVPCLIRSHSKLAGSRSCWVASAPIRSAAECWN